MPAEMITIDDLNQFRLRLLQDIKDLLSKNADRQPAEIPRGLKTKEVRKILGCSNNTLVLLRTQKLLRVKKIGGTLYYSQEDIQQLSQKGFT